MNALRSKKVILDTDTGVDDALAIILAMRSPELDVQAITTVSGNVDVDLCTLNVLRLLSLLRPTRMPLVASGCARPLVKAPFSVATVHGQDGLGDLGDDFFGSVDRSPMVSDSASDLILKLVRRHPDDLHLIATGPLTNVATAIARDPLAMRRLGSITIMGGAFRVPGNIPPGAAEFNAFVDPHALEQVLRFGLDVSLVGLDVTHQVPLMRAEVIQRLGSKQDLVCRFVVAATEKYMDFYQNDQAHDGCYLHDPLAVGIVIDPTFVDIEPQRIYVETEGNITAGMTMPFRHPTRNPRLIDPPNANICTGVDSPRFTSFFLDRIDGTTQ